VASILVIGWFLFGDAREWLTAWIGDSGHFVSGLKVGLILIVISSPGVLLRGFFFLQSHPDDYKEFNVIAITIGLIIGISFSVFVFTCATWGLVLALALFADH